MSPLATPPAPPKKKAPPKGIFSKGSCLETGIRPLSDLQEFAVIARPLRRTGPIPFAPFPPLADHPLMAAPRDNREGRVRSRWLAAPHAAHGVHTLHAGRTAPNTPPHSLLPSTSKPDSAPSQAPISSSDTPRSPRGSCHAVYHGQGTLSVLSSITGHHYRFEGRGCTLTIDPRDRLVLGRLNELSIHSAST